MEIKKNLTSLLFFFAFLFKFLFVNGQISKDSLLVEEVTIIKSFQPSLKNVKKIDETSLLNDSIYDYNDDIEYNIISFPAVSTFVPARLEPRNIKSVKKSIEFDSYLASGVGNFKSYLIEYSSGLKIDRNQSIEWMIMLDAISKKISDSRLDNSRNSSLVNILYSINNNYYNSESQINFYQNKRSFYGLRNESIIEKDFTSIDPAQNINYLSLSSTWNWYDSFLNSLNFKSFFTSDRFKTGEFEFELNSKFQFDISDFIINISPSINYFTNQFKKDFYTGEPEKTKSWKSELSLVISNYSKKLSYKFGIITNYGFMDNFEEGRIFYYPYIDLLYKSNSSLSNVYLNLNGGLDFNNFRKLSYSNYFIAPTVQLKNTNSDYDLKLGFRSLISKNLSFDLNTYITKYKNYPLFINYGIDYFNFSFLPYKYGNSFKVIYDDIDFMGFNLKLIRKMNFGSIRFAIKTNHRKTYNFKHAFNIPKYKIEFVGNIKLSRKIFFNWEINYIGNRYNAFKNQFLQQNPSSANLDYELLRSSFITNLELQYDFTEKWNVFIKGENLLGKNNYFWSNYFEQSPLFLSGLKYNFNF